MERPMQIKSCYSKYEIKSINLSFNFSNIYDPIPEPVPPAIEWQSTNPLKKQKTELNVEFRAHCKYHIQLDGDSSSTSLYDI